MPTMSAIASPLSWAVQPRAVDMALGRRGVSACRAEWWAGTVTPTLFLFLCHAQTLQDYYYRGYDDAVSYLRRLSE